jgi:ubiquinone/menaquinone biosynthesis C-methylase UbiE
MKKNSGFTVLELLVILGIITILIGLVLTGLNAAQKLNNIEVVWGNAEKIGGTKIRENIADRIIVSNVLFQVAKPDDFCLEIKRLTKTGGKVLVVDWSDISPIGPKNVVSAEKARLLFEKHGFKLDQSFDAGDHHYGLIFIKT